MKFGNFDVWVVVDWLFLEYFSKYLMENLSVVCKVVDKGLFVFKVWVVVKCVWEVM